MAQKLPYVQLCYQGGLRFLPFFCCLHLPFGEIKQQMSLYRVFYFLLISTLGLIPYKLLYFIGKVISFLFLIIPNKHKRISLVNLKLIFPDLSHNEIMDLLKDSLFHSSMNFLESGMVWGRKDYANRKGFIDVRNFQSVILLLSTTQY